MDILDLEEGLKICSDYLSEADKVIEMLGSDVTSHLVEECGYRLVQGVLVCISAAEVATKAGERQFQFSTQV